MLFVTMTDQNLEILPIVLVYEFSNPQSHHADVDHNGL